MSAVLQAERAVAREMRAGGSTLREISELLGRPISSVAEWCTDDAEAKSAARRRRSLAKLGLIGKCADCGGETRGRTSGEPVPERCRSCSRAHETAVAKARVIDALQRWYAERGEVSARDWSTRTMRERSGADRFGAPFPSSVIRMFGSWNAAVEAAGITPRKSGGRAEQKYVTERSAPVAGRLCLADDCGAPAKSRGLCDSHYQRARYWARKEQAA